MVLKLNPSQSIIALDIGAARIGVARAGSIARLPEPLEAISNDDNVFDILKSIIEREEIGLVVIGIPRNLKGEETPQSQVIRDFASRLSGHIELEVVFVDESFSSKRADEYLKGLKKPDVSQDSVAACYILEEFFKTSENI